MFTREVKALNKLKRLLEKNRFIYNIALFTYALAKLIAQIPVLIRELFYSIIYYKSVRLTITNHLTIGVKILGEKRVWFPHPIGIVIGKMVIIGSGCKIYQNVTIGSKDELGLSYPKIGNNVTIYANSILVGDISIGDNVIIGAGTFVNADVPDNAIAVGNPMRVIQSVVKATKNEV